MSNIQSLRDIDSAEHSVLSELKLLGYFHIKCQRYKSSEDILFEADGELRHILVRARICGTNNEKIVFSTNEKKQLRKRAEKGHREAWIAVLKYDDKVGGGTRIHWDTV